MEMGTEMTTKNLPEYLIMEYPFGELIDEATSIFGSNPFTQAYNVPGERGYNPKRRIFYRTTEELLFYLFLNLRITGRDIYMGMLPLAMPVINELYNKVQWGIVDSFYQDESYTDGLVESGLLMEEMREGVLGYRDKWGNKVEVVPGITEDQSIFITVIYHLFLRVFIEKFPTISNIMLQNRDSIIVQHEDITQSMEFPTGANIDKRRAIIDYILKVYTLTLRVYVAGRETDGL
uniref:Uncharacterized protein n=1 Tax=Myoviridae sp. ctLnO19 TaxID=2825085 RepID=A0A8S5P1K7_9CAUD|nr:MAG TPA: hypothetical protein [Myoviridae sp. ctLnO19]